MNAAVNKGRYYVREMIALIQLKKYRTLKGRYESERVDEEFSSDKIKPYDAERERANEIAEEK